MKTFIPKKEDIERKWYLIDAEEKILGRIASKIATILRGKHKPSYTQHLDTGDFVVVINANKVKVTGNKYNDKVYKSYSGYPGGLKERTFKEMMKKSPEKIIFSAVKGMLPKNKLGRKMLKKLKVYSGSEHLHAAQKLEKID